MSRISRLLKTLLLARERCAAAIARVAVEAIEREEPWVVDEAWRYLQGEVVDHEDVAERYLGSRSSDAVERVRRGYESFLSRIDTSCPSRRLAYVVGSKVMDRILSELESLEAGQPIDKILQELLRRFGREINGAEGEY